MPKPPLAALAALALVAVPAAVAATKPPPLLRGTVGPGPSITLKNAAGKRVTVLKAGRYRIRVNDRSSSHNFRLRGPGLNRQITGISYRGTRTVTLRLAKGRFTFVCDPHRSFMRGSFRVR